jgi:prevent-host-death family protein
MSQAPKMTIVSLAEAKANLSKLIDRVQRGERFTITRRGKPVADVVPIATRRSPLPTTFFDEIDRSATPQRESVRDFFGV